jgi:thymidylate synthase
MDTFEGGTADEVWIEAASRFSSGEGVAQQGSRSGETDEVLHAAFEMRDPRQRWIVSRTPALNPAFALAEVVWIVQGRQDSAFLNYWNSKLPEYAGKGEAYDGAYGYRLRHNFGMDQLERAYHTLKNNPETRQVVLQIWDSGRDLPEKNGSPRSEDVPCNVTSLLKVRNGKLEWAQILRSNDLYRGVPHNFVQFTSLQEVLAGWLDIKVGTYTHFADSLHVYAHERETVYPPREIEAKPNTDTLSLSKSDSDRCFEGLASRVDSFTAANLDRSEHRDATAWKEAPEAIQNMLYVFSAEAARRREWPDLAHDAMGRCSNPAFTQIWDRWWDRVK